ncbi:uncharacterized protein LOC126234981 [Schistocerca nitens]|uniref:uncharacterized protein LOC126234981 n=1 Tax=Schistocerca nitens TaxID=7011 RepID=UPI00211915F7|nr:uncharacterized protein LOC126234981 [Schistocerca nitens]
MTAVIEVAEPAASPPRQAVLRAAAARGRRRDVTPALQATQRRVRLTAGTATASPVRDSLAARALRRTPAAMLVLTSTPRVVSGVRKQRSAPGGGGRPEQPRAAPAASNLRLADDTTALKRAEVTRVLRCLWDGVSRHCEVRAGSLEVLGSEPGCCLRLPLCRLHLRPHPALPRAFTLGTDPEAPAAAFQAVSESDFSRWVRTLAVELLRQTPLDALRYLDVLAITATTTAAPSATGTNHHLGTNGGGAWHQPRARSEDSRGWAAHRHHAYRDRSENRAAGCGRLSRRDASAAAVTNGDAANHGHSRNQPATTTPDSSEEDDEEREVAALLRRCQRADGVATVGDKRRLFEALCRRRARSQDALTRALPPALPGADVVGCGAKRARSLHDLRAGPVTSAVRDMCRLFEERVQQQQQHLQPQQQQLGEQLHRRRGVSVGREATAVLCAQSSKQPTPTHTTTNNSCSSGGSNNNSCSNSNNQLACRRRVRRAERRLARLQELSAAAEDKVWRLQEDMAAIDRHRSPANTHRTNTLYAALEQRLSLEEARLTRLQQESQRVLKEVEEATGHLETATASSRDRRSRRLAP